MSGLNYAAGFAGKGKAVHLLYWALPAGKVVSCGAGEAGGKRARAKVKSGDLSEITCKRCAAATMRLLEDWRDQLALVVARTGPSAYVRDCALCGFSRDCTPTRGNGSPQSPLDRFLCAECLEDERLARERPLERLATESRTVAELVEALPDDSTEEDW